MEEEIKYFSEIQNFEIININDGEKYGFLSSNDVIIDDEGTFRSIIIDHNRGRFSFFGGGSIFEIPWEYVKKIGVRTIIIEIDENQIKTLHKKK